MNNIKRFIVSILFVLSLCTISATGSKDVKPVEKTISRIIAIQPADVEIIYALGAQDLLVGRGSFCDYPASVADVADIGSGETLSIETMIALKPDVVIMGIMGQKKEQAEVLRRAHITVIATNASTISEVYSTIKTIASLCSKEDEGEKLIKDMKSSFARIKELSFAQKSEAKTVYFEVSPLQWGLWTAGTHTFMDEIAALCGVKNIFSDVEGWGSISEEQVLMRNPDMIVSTQMYFGKGMEPATEIKSRSGWNVLKAVKSNAVFTADANTTARPGPRLVEAAEQFYNFVYGK